MRAFVATACFAAVIATTTQAWAQSATENLPQNPPAQAVVAAPAPQTIRIAEAVTVRPEQKKRPAPLLPMYISYVGLQMGDAFTTVKALGLGAHEANGIMGGITKHPVPFYALKMAVAGLGVVGAERMWRKGGRKSAVVVMLAGNVLMGVVVNHNRHVIDAFSR